MGLLAPSALILGAVLAAGLIALYLLRPRRLARPVSSTLLWLAALNDVHAQRPWRRIPPRLLLLLELATILALSVALARPFVLQSGAPGPFTVLLIQTSASMQATDVSPSRFAVAQQRARALIEAFPRTTSVALISIDAEPRVVSPPSIDRQTLEQALASLQPDASSPHLMAALALAQSVAADHPDAQVTIVGDGSLDREHAVPTSFPLPIRWLGVGSTDAANVSVSGLAAHRVDGRVSALARVVNNSAAPAQTSLTLRVDGARFDARSLTLDPFGTAEADWTDIPASAHTLEARLATPDTFALDDAAWTVLGWDRPTNVVLITDGNALLARALALRPHSSVTVLRPGDALPTDGPIDLVVCDGVPPPSLGPATALWLIHPPTDSSLLSVAPDVDVSAVSPDRADDPLVADLPLADVHVARARRLRTPGWADENLTAPETALLLTGTSGGRRLAVLGFDVHQSDLPLSPAFPILVQRLFDWLVPYAATATPDVSVGDPVALAPLAGSVHLTVIDPAGGTTSLAPADGFTFAATTMPGLYTVVERDAAGMETQTAFAVNFTDPQQSRVLPGADMHPALAATPLQVVSAQRELWDFLAGLALACVALELLVDWWHFFGPGARPKLALALRAAAAAAIILALVGASLPQPATRQATLFVVDASRSMDGAQPDPAAFIASAIAHRQPDDVFGVVSTGRTPVVSQAVGRGALDPLALGSVDPNGTDLDAGLRLAGSLLPSGYRSRIVVLSDGQETQGRAVAAARDLAARGVQVDTVHAGRASRPEALVDNVTVPATVRQGERFPIGVHLASTTSTDARVRVMVNGQPLADATTSLARGRTDLRFAAVADRSGLLDVTATIEPRDDTLPDNNTAHAVVSVDGPPRVLIVEGRPNEGDVIASALGSSGVTIETRPPEALPDTVDALGAFASVVLADVPATGLTPSQLNALRSLVRDLGHGIVAIGGDTSFGQGDYVDTPLDEILPVRSSVRAHRDTGRTAMVLVLDRSGSMGDDVGGEGATKLQMARQATVLAARQLGPRDMVGLLAFDSQQHWLLPLTPMLGLGASALDDRLSDLTADGGTDIYPALTTAVDGIAAIDARYKHVILLTDGQSCCPGNYPALLDRMRQASITLSTIGIGSDADGELLSNLARQGDGRYYFTDRARDIPRFITRETELATRGPVLEAVVHPRQTTDQSTLSDVGGDGFPALAGYLVTNPKATAQVLLASDAGDPLLARWQVGLGRAVAWTSDLRGRWSDAWLSWSATPRVINDLVTWTLPARAGPLRVSVRQDSTSAHILADLSNPHAPAMTVHARVARPDGTATDVDLRPTAPGRYAGSVALGQPGAYAVRVEAHGDNDASASAETGIAVSYSPELRQVGIDDARLNAISLAGHGHDLSEPAAAFADDLAPVTTPLPLRDVLLHLAPLLVILDVALRRLRLSVGDIRSWVRHPHGLSVELPWGAPATGVPAAPWQPGVWIAERRTPPSRVRPLSPVTLGSQVTPGLARTESPPATDESSGEETDALGDTLRWLAARRGTSHGDRG